MTYEEAVEWLDEHLDDTYINIRPELNKVFEAIMGRRPKHDDYRFGRLSLIFEFLGIDDS